MILAQGAFLIQCHPSCKSYEFREQQWLIEFLENLMMYVESDFIPG
jgi:hypothetical protein